MMSLRGYDEFVSAVIPTKVGIFVVKSMDSRLHGNDEFMWVRRAHHSGIFFINMPHALRFGFQILLIVLLGTCH